MLQTLFKSIIAPWPLVVASAIWIVATSSVQASEEKKSFGDSDDAAIRATADAFVKAFNERDAVAVASLWTESGSLVDEQGRTFKGRKAIEDEYAALFKQQPDAKVEVVVQAIEFPAPGLAIEDGLARGLTKDAAPPVASRYTAIHVLQEGKWLMASVRETGIALPSNYGRLQEFEWLVGNWETKAEGGVVQMSVRWIADKSFLERDYTVRHDGMTTSSGVQIIGWDPQSGRVRSWSFDASGGHGTGDWTPTPQGWRIGSTGVLPDGTPTSSQDFLIRVPGDDNVLGWRSLNRRVGTATLPDTREVVLERIAEKH